MRGVIRGNKLARRIREDRKMNERSRVFERVDAQSEQVAILIAPTGIGKSHDVAHAFLTDISDGHLPLFVTDSVENMRGFRRELVAVAARMGAITSDADVDNFPLTSLGIYLTTAQDGNDSINTKTMTSLLHKKPGTVNGIITNHAYTLRRENDAFYTWLAKLADQVQKEKISRKIRIYVDEADSFFASLINTRALQARYGARETAKGCDLELVSSCPGSKKHSYNKQAPCVTCVRSNLTTEGDKSTGCRGFSFPRELGAESLLMAQGGEIQSGGRSLQQIPVYHLPAEDKFVCAKNVMVAEFDNDTPAYQAAWDTYPLHRAYGGKNGAKPPSASQALASRLETGYRRVVKRITAQIREKTKTGVRFRPIDPAEITRIYETEDKSKIRSVIFPNQPCGIDTLEWFDPMPLVLMKRLGAKVTFLSATERVETKQMLDCVFGPVPLHRIESSKAVLQEITVILDRNPHPKILRHGVAIIDQLPELHHKGLNVLYMLSRASDVIKLQGHNGGNSEVYLQEKKGMRTEFARMKESGKYGIAHMVAYAHGSLARGANMGEYQVSIIDTRLYKPIFAVHTDWPVTEAKLTEGIERELQITLTQVMGRTLRLREDGKPDGLRRLLVLQRVDPDTEPFCLYLIDALKQRVIGSHVKVIDDPKGFGELPLAAQIGGWFLEKSPEAVMFKPTTKLGEELKEDLGEERVALLEEQKESSKEKIREFVSENPGVKKREVYQKFNLARLKQKGEDGESLLSELDTFIWELLNEDWTAE